MQTTFFKILYKEMLTNLTSFRKLKTKRRSPRLLCKWKVVKSFILALTFGFVHFEALENNTQELIVFTVFLLEVY